MLKGITPTLFALTLAAVMSAGAAQAQTGPVSHWIFDGNSISNNRVREAGGSSLSGTIVGPVRLSDHPPALILDGVQNSVKMGTTIPRARRPHQNLTLEVWVKFTAISLWGGIIDFHQDNGSLEKGWFLGNSLDHFLFSLSTQGSAPSGRDLMTYLEAKTPFVPERWYHVVSTYDGREMRLYVNGELDNTSDEQSGPIKYPSSAFYEIGAYHDDDEYFRIKGAIHEARVYNRALSAEEIAEHYLEKAELFQITEGPYVHLNDEGEATISWKTYHPMPSLLEFGGSGAAESFDRRIGDETPKTDHALTIDDVETGVEYAYRIVAPDAVPLSQPKVFERGKGLVSHWIFDRDHISDRTVRDLAGDRDAEILGPVTIHPHRSAIILDGVTNELILGRDVSPDELPQHQLTVEAWVNLPWPTEWGGLIGYIQDNAFYEKGWLLGNKQNKFLFGLASEGTDDGDGICTYLTAEHDITPGQWHHVVGTYDGARQRLYVDGVQEALSYTQSGKILYPPSAPFVIGALHDDDERFLSKQILHEVLLYDRALSEEEVQARYEAKRALFENPLTEPPIVRYETFDEVSIEWKTRVATGAMVEYGVGTPVGRRLGDPIRNTEHEIRLMGLERDAAYQYVIKSQGEGGEQAISDYTLDLSWLRNGGLATEFFFAENFDSFHSDAHLREAGWATNTLDQLPDGDNMKTDTPTVEHADFRLLDRLRLRPLPSGSPATGKCLISASETTHGQGVGYYDLGYLVESPPIDCSRATRAVWLHFSGQAYLDHGPGAIFEVWVSGDGGAQWERIDQRVSTMRNLPPYADTTNANGFSGVRHLDITEFAAGKEKVKIRWVHRGLDDDFHVMVDDVVIDDGPPGGTAELFAMETFDGVASDKGGVPEGWRVKSNCNDNPWGVYTRENRRRNIAENSGTVESQILNQFDANFMILDSQRDPDTCADAEYLITPTIDAERAEIIYLHFESVILLSGQASERVELSLDGGKTFEAAPVWDYDLVYIYIDWLKKTQYTEHVIPVPRAAGASQVAFRFAYDEGNGDAGFWAIDNVKVTADLKGLQPVAEAELFKD